jgi:hypothetical protein
MPTSADRIAQLEAEVAELRALVAPSRPKRAPFRSRPRRALVIFGVVLALVIPAATFAGGQTFNDVPPSHTFFNAIEEVAAAGVTQGCGDGSNYCPNGLVNRGQMAAFMSRLGALSPSRPPVVNAKTSQSTDGWSFGCPANTTYNGGLCFDNSQRGNATDIYDASNKCATIGTALPLLGGHRWHLPGANELLSAARITGLNLTGTAEWTSDMWIDSDDGWSGLKVFNFLGNDVSVAALGGDDGPYRCATEPISWDGISFVILADPGAGTLPASGEAADAQIDMLDE